MTKDQLIRLNDILDWAKRVVKTDAMFDQICAMQKVVKTEINIIEAIEVRSK